MRNRLIDSYIDSCMSNLHKSSDVGFLRKVLEKSGWNTRRLYDGRFEICKEVNGVSCSYRSLDFVHLYRLANKFNTDAYSVKYNL